MNCLRRLQKCKNKSGKDDLFFQFVLCLETLKSLLRTLLHCLSTRNKILDKRSENKFNKESGSICGPYQEGGQ